MGETGAGLIRRTKFTMADDWLVLFWVGFMHVGAFFAFFTFTWKALGVCLFLWWLTGGVGVCLGLHRYFTHRSYRTPKWVEYCLAFLACLAGESGPIAWVAAHRYHHINSDTEKDPHSPEQGFLWAHMTWLFGRENFLTNRDSYKKYAPDMANDRFLVLLDRYHMVPVFFMGGLLYVLGGWSFVVWGMFVRSVIVYHSTWLVNSAGHVWGYRSFETGEKSRNNWWVALLSFGEGWHNNHHAFQRSARHGFRWWEIDFTYIMIRVMEFLGLASQVQVPVENAEMGMTRPRKNF